MASGMKRWSLVALAGILLVSIRLLPVGSVVEPRTLPEPRPERERFLELQQELTAAAEQIDRLTWLSAALAQLDAARTDGRTVIVDAPADVEPGIPGREERLAAELEGDPHVVDVGVFARRLLPQPQDGVRRWARRHDEYYVGLRAGRPFCLVLRITSEYDSRLSLYGPDVMLDRENEMADFCGFVSRYGLPGHGVASWLRSGALARGTLRKPETPRRHVGGYVPSPPRLEYLTTTAMGCLDGNRQACSEVFLNPWHGDSSQELGRAVGNAVPELWGVESQSRAHHFNAVESFLLSDIEIEFGRESFARFWTSDAPLESAFEDAFGLPAGEWVFRWARGYYPEARIRAGLDFGTLWAPVTVLILGMLVGLSKARGREV